MHINSFAAILAEATPPAGAPPNPIISFLPMILLVVVFYFILIRPQQQRAKQQKKMLEALKSGDKVMTSSGIIAIVVTVKEKSVTLRSADSKLEVSKVSVTDILDANTPTE